MVRLQKTGKVCFNFFYFTLHFGTTSHTYEIDLVDCWYTNRFGLLPTIRAYRAPKWNIWSWVFTPSTVPEAFENMSFHPSRTSVVLTKTIYKMGAPPLLPFVFSHFCIFFDKPTYKYVYLYLIFPSIYSHWLANICWLYAIWISRAGPPTLVWPFRLL